MSQSRHPGQVLSRAALWWLAVCVVTALGFGTKYLVTRSKEWMLLATGACVLLFLALIFAVPVLLIPSSKVDPSRTQLSAADRIQGINAVRALLIQIVAGLVLVLGLFYTAQTLRTSEKTFDLNRESQISEQYAQAINELGQGGVENADVRAGGIYLLGLLDDQALRDGSSGAVDLHLTIVRILGNYLLQHDSMGNVQPPQQNRGTSGGPMLDSDFQAIVTVLTRHPQRQGEDPLVLFDLDLGGVDLRGANLAGVNLSFADLEWANLRGANLDGADLRGACLLFAQYDSSELRVARTDKDTITTGSGRLCGRAAQ